MLTIWENTYGCAEQYICASALYIVSYLLQCYSVIIDRGISTPGHGKEVVDGLNTIGKRYGYQLMSNVQLTGSKRLLPQMQMHTITQNNDVSLAK